MQFWDDEAPDTSSYWAIQRECHNAATLEMIRDAIDSQDPSNPIRLIKERERLGKRSGIDDASRQRGPSIF